MIEAGGGNVRLLKWKEYPADWDPTHRRPASRLGSPLPAHLRLQYGWRQRCGQGAHRRGAKAEAARQLAYRLYTLCERPAAPRTLGHITKW